MPRKLGSLFIFLLSFIRAFTKILHLSPLTLLKKWLFQETRISDPCFQLFTGNILQLMVTIFIHPPFSSQLFVSSLPIITQRDLLLSIKLNAHLLSYKSKKGLFTRLMDHSFSVYCLNVSPLWNLKSVGVNRFGLCFMLAEINDQACFCLWGKAHTSCTHCSSDHFMIKP